MKLNHLDLVVPDVQATAAFLVSHFAFKRISNDKSPAIAILEDSGGLVLVLQRREGSDQGALGHLGFYVDTVDEVHAKHAELQGASPVETNGRGTMFYVRAPGGIVIEVNCRRVS